MVLYNFGLGLYWFWGVIIDIDNFNAWYVAQALSSIMISILPLLFFIIFIVFPPDENRRMMIE